MCEVDLLDSFGHELEWQIQRNGDFLSSPENFALRDRLAGVVGAWQDLYGDEGELKEEDNADFLWETLISALEVFAPPYCYFGPHPGDGCDYGFWPNMDAIDELPHEGGQEVGEDYKVVSDHGNVTVFGGDGRELLGVV